MKRYNIRFQMMKQQRIGIFILIILIFLIEFFIYYDIFLPKSSKTIDLPKEVLALHNEENTNHELKLQPFNPNEMTDEKWKAMGFTERQIKTINKYKNVIGGEFKSVEQFGKCYAVKERFEELKPYIILPNNLNDIKYNNKYHKINKYKLQTFNPNTYTLNDWVSIGFSPRQAENILKYKNSLGGQFNDLNEIKACYMISEEKYNELKPYIKLVAIKSETRINKKENKSNLLNINDCNISDLERIGLPINIASRVIKIRKKLGGFSTSKDLDKVPQLSEEFKNKILKSFKFE